MRKIKAALLGLLVLGCAGMDRSCSSGMAETFGADWVVVQYDLAGRPFKCWHLTNTSITNEPQSDGIYWVSGSGNLIHISGLYNRAQVVNSNWNGAYAEVGLTKETCEKVHNKMYSLPEEDKK